MSGVYNWSQNRKGQAMMHRFVVKVKFIGALRGARVLNGEIFTLLVNFFIPFEVKDVKLKREKVEIEI